jgi:hypothetical protein
VAEAQVADAVEALGLAEQSALSTARETMRSGLAQLLTAIQRLDDCTSLKTTVDVLAQSLATVVPRSMVFIMRADELRGWHLHGFTEAPDPFSLSVPVPEAGPLAETATTGLSRYVPADTFSGPLAFAALRESRQGVAVPVVLGHTTVALIYADDGGSPNRMIPSGWEEMVQILARHASRHLEALTAARTVRLAGLQRSGAPAGSGMLSGGLHGAASSAS